MVLDIREIQAAMSEAFNVQVQAVQRPAAVKGETETWLEVTLRGRHVGWLPADTNPQAAINTARRWLQQNREIARADRSIRPTGRLLAGRIVNHMTETRA